MVTYSSYSTSQSDPSVSPDPSSRSPPLSPSFFLSYSVSQRLTQNQKSHQTAQKFKPKKNKKFPIKDANKDLLEKQILEKIKLFAERCKQ